ncbi:hypothetical protein [Elizabethkingia miricola]|uniref:hypothetical protein n=1 Tax=Elizabethkingia miricola TaxID=172045 RepID=UPI000B35BEFC|nr:hypothetical protein [Elizabethkingia miricola]NHQ67166.1 hypothetical protein [Elizabethkingia miricola]NHQ71206.1 hypothetical protein [Elizabethkingia miricola]NHQ76554.1 hypothetical protein [Elizabethkingia miricola]UIO96372.1 hypothetical protein LYZ41_19505 [Elizabethkingia miricola]WER13157.1 hypothetical protein P0M31_19245 [Elizabethkingia miricola]
MAIQKRKSKHENLTDGSGNLTKKQQNQKALEVLAKAKEINKGKPVRFLSASDSVFGRSLKK